MHLDDLNVEIAQYSGGVPHQSGDQICTATHVAGLYDYGVLSRCGNARFLLLTKSSGPDYVNYASVRRPFRDIDRYCRSREINHRFRTAE